MCAKYSMVFEGHQISTWMDYDSGNDISLEATIELYYITTTEPSK